MWIINLVDQRLLGAKAAMTARTREGPLASLIFTIERFSYDLEKRFR